MINANGRVINFGDAKMKLEKIRQIGADSAELPDRERRAAICQLLMNQACDDATEFSEWKNNEKQEWAEQVIDEFMSACPDAAALFGDMEKTLLKRAYLQTLEMKQTWDVVLAQRYRRL